MTRSYAGIDWKDHAPDLVSEEQIRRLEEWAGSKIPDAYRKFLLEVNGGSPVYKGVSDPVNYKSDCIYLEDLYCLDFSDNNYRLEIKELNEYNRSDDCYTVPPHVLMIGGADCVYQIGISLAKNSYGKVLHWHPDAIHWDSDDDMSSKDWAEFLSDNVIHDSFDDLLQYTRQLAQQDDSEGTPLRGAPDL